MRSIAVVNQKGGCGKTTTAINLAAFLAKNGRGVLLVDLDPQGHATLGLRTGEVRPGATIGEVLLKARGPGGTPGVSEVIETILPGLDLVPADIALSTVPEKLATVDGRESRLAEALKEVWDAFHYVIVDCPPNLGLLTFNALMACSEAVIPVDPSFFSLHGIGKMLETIELLVRKTGHEIEPQALITLYSGRAEFVKEVAADIRKHLGERVFRTVIRYSVKLAEAASHGLPVSAYCRHCVGFDDYESLAAEVMQQEARRPVPQSLVKASRREFPEAGIPAGIYVPCAPVSINDGVLFTLDAPGAHCVQLAGDFNSWRPDGNEMQWTSGYWRKVVSLSPGRYRYRYVVDGNWQSDPMNSDVEPSPYGDFDSVVILNGERAAL